MGFSAKTALSARRACMIYGKWVSVAEAITTASTASGPFRASSNWSDQLQPLSAAIRWAFSLSTSMTQVSFTACGRSVMDCRWKCPARPRPITATLTTGFWASLVIKPQKTRLMQLLKLLKQFYASGARRPTRSLTQQANVGLIPLNNWTRGFVYSEYLLLTSLKLCHWPQAAK